MHIKITVEYIITQKERKKKKISFIKKRKKKQKVRSVFFLFFFSFKVDTPINEQWSLRKFFLNKGKKMKKLDC